MVVREATQGAVAGSLLAASWSPDRAYRIDLDHSPCCVERPSGVDEQSIKGLRGDAR
jgi:hypothetical protein